MSSVQKEKERENSVDMDEGGGCVEKEKVQSSAQNSR